MAKFLIQDPQSGKTVTVEGSNPPSQAEAEQIFNQAGLRAQSKPSFTQGASSFVRGLGLGALPDAAAAVTGLVQGGITKNNPFITQDEFGKVKQEGQMNTLKDAAGLASWAVPETKLLEGGNLITRLFAGLINKGVQGGLMGGLGAVSQGQDPIQGAEVGAVVNPALAGVGKFATDTLPRYIGFRNFGPAGLKLPEVTKAENAAQSVGVDTLKQARTDILSKIKPFALEGQPGYVANSQTDRQTVLDKINELANSSQWKGTNGLSDLVKKSRRAFPSPEGAAPDLKSLINNSSDLFDAYSQLKNYASSLGVYGSKQTDKLSNFIKSAAGVVREQLINTSENPKELRTAMDNYAAQTAMGAGKSKGGGVLNILQNAAKGGPNADIGLAGLASIIPSLHGLAGIPLADYALTNSVTGPGLARGLVNAGQASSDNGVSNFLRRLGIGGAQSVIQNN